MRASSADIERLPSDFRIKDLREWHLVEAACWHCKQTGAIDSKALMRGRSPDTRLVDLEGRLRCTICDEIGPAAGHTTLARAAPRNY